MPFPIQNCSQCVREDCSLLCNEMDQLMIFWMFAQDSTALERLTDTLCSKKNPSYASWPAYLPDFFAEEASKIYATVESHLFALVSFFCVQTQSRHSPTIAALCAQELESLSCSGENCKCAMIAATNDPESAALVMVYGTLRKQYPSLLADIHDVVEQRTVLTTRFC